MQLTTMDQGGTATLSQAILVYQARQIAYSGKPAKVSYATLHPIAIGEDGAATIAPGKLLKREALEAALGDLALGAGAQPYRFTEASVIASGPGMTAWFTPSRARHMVFAGGGLRGDGVATQPAMLWIATPNDLHVFALGSDARPEKDAPVFHAPHYNVWKGGRLCIGSAKKPDSLDPQAWEEMFYASAFTHPNDGADWQTRQRGGPAALWKKLLKEAATKPFPNAVLAPTGATVAQIIDGVMSTGTRSAG